jgi:hypothetical protein
MVLLDTNIVLNYIRKYALVPDACFISIVTVGELKAFALKRNWGKQKKERTFDEVGPNYFLKIGPKILSVRVVLHKKIVTIFVTFREKKLFFWRYVTFPVLHKKIVTIFVTVGPKKKCFFGDRRISDFSRLSNEKKSFFFVLSQFYII